MKWKRVSQSSEGPVFNVNQVVYMYQASLQMEAVLSLPRQFSRATLDEVFSNKERSEMLQGNKNNNNLTPLKFSL